MAMAHSKAREFLEENMETFEYEPYVDLSKESFVQGDFCVIGFFGRPERADEAVMEASAKLGKSYRPLPSMIYCRVPDNKIQITTPYLFIKRVEDFCGKYRLSVEKEPVEGGTVYHLCNNETRLRLATLGRSEFGTTLEDAILFENIGVEIYGLSTGGPEQPEKRSKNKVEKIPTRGTVKEGLKRLFTTPFRPRHAIAWGKSRATDGYEESKE